MTYTRKTVLLLLLLLAMFSGCLSGQLATSEVIALNIDMTIEEFLTTNGLSYENATNIVDRNENGENDLFIWDFDEDGNGDVLIDLNEEIKKGEHGQITYGFNKILVFDYTKHFVLIADVGKNSKKIITITSQNIE